MGSFASVTVDSYEVSATKNHYSQGFFKKSDRRVDSDEDGERHYFATTAATLRRRMELRGWDRGYLESELRRCIDQRIEDLQGYQEYYKEAGDAPDLELQQAIDIYKRSTVDAWLEALAIAIRKQLHPYRDLLPTGNPLVDCLYVDGGALEQSYDPGRNLTYPIDSDEIFTLAAVHVVADDAPCVLDISALVSGGWVPGFSDIAEQQQPHTNIFGVFLASLDSVRRLSGHADNDRTLCYMLYAHLVTAYETYLGDTIRKNVLGRPPLLRRFVEKNPSLLPEKKISYDQIFREMDRISAVVSDQLDNLLYHRTATVVPLLKSVFLIEPDSQDMAEVSRAIAIRHDIVHRSGKTTTGNLREIDAKHVDELMVLLERVVRSIDQKVKDGLVDHDEED